MYHGGVMALVRTKELDVNARLRELDLSRPILLDVLRKCVGAYGDCTDNDPPSAKGYEPYRIGTRQLREVVLPGREDWEKDDTANLSSIKNDKLRIKVVVLNTTDKTGNPDPKAVPRNRVEKGILHERAIRSVDCNP
jgi:hypothetical protein